MQPKPKRLYSPDELNKALKEFAFDVYHFRCYIGLFRQGVPDPTYQQALVYSLLLHFRVMLDFFFSTPRMDDVACVHFASAFPEFETRFGTVSEPDPALAENVRQELHKRLAHLTATRWEKKAPTMTFYERLFDPVNALTARFEEALPENERHVLKAELHQWELRHP